MEWIANLIQFLIGPVAVLLVGFWVDRRSKRRADKVQWQLENNHKVNIRDDLDSKFHLVFAKLDHSNSLHRKQGKVIIGMRSDIAELFENDVSQTKDVEALREEIRKGDQKSSL